jgi:hypothetical protein
MWLSMADWRLLVVGRCLLGLSIEALLSLVVGRRLTLLWVDGVHPCRY